MPRKAKEKEELKETKKTTKKSTSTKKTTKATATKKAAATKAVKTTKKEAENKNSKTKTTKTTQKTKATKPTTKKKTTTTKRKTVSKKKEIESIVTEYYDLPQKYNETVVKVLAQTPKTLFIYWEISDEDMEKYKTLYGENFFETTKPVLIIRNNTIGYSFEVEINDFANSWYLHVDNSKSDYKIELGRRPINNNTNNNDYIYITSSNEIESPNDHILFNNSQKMVYFKNVKTNKITEKNISTLSFIRNMGKIYDIYDLYKELYKNEDNLEDLSNPSSYMSSQFK